jgi:uncharacterized membrane protein (DUF485 family)
MIRLVLAWFVLTVLLFGVRYFVDTKTKAEARHWGIRFAVQGFVVACLLGLVIFLERL